MGEAEFKCLAEFPEYEINRLGEVRRVSGGRSVTPRKKQGSGLLWVQLTQGGKQFGRTLSVLLVEAFGPGAAQAAGMAEPDMRRVQTSRGRKPGSGRARGGRVCRCGKPTRGGNYRCEECWKNVRGFGTSAASAHETPFDI